MNFSSKYRVVAADSQKRVARGGCEMYPQLVYFWLATPAVGFGLVRLQARLERWDYERHAED